MTKLQFLEVEDATAIAALAATAKEIWEEYFPGIITPAQVDYMVEKYQSLPALSEQIFRQGYRYWLLRIDGEAGGYIGLKPEGERMLLSKLYLKKACRGRGHFHAMLSFIEETARELGAKTLYLTVNRYNEQAIAVYRKKGFCVAGELAADIGSGFVMDDYIMEKHLSPGA